MKTVNVLGLEIPFPLLGFVLGAAVPVVVTVISYPIFWLLGMAAFRGVWVELRSCLILSVAMSMILGTFHLLLSLFPSPMLWFIRGFAALAALGVMGGVVQELDKRGQIAQHWFAGHWSRMWIAFFGPPVAGFLLPFLVIPLAGVVGTILGVLEWRRDERERKKRDEEWRIESQRLWAQMQAEPEEQPVEEPSPEEEIADEDMEVEIHQFIVERNDKIAQAHADLGDDPLLLEAEIQHINDEYETRVEELRQRRRKS